MSAFPLISVALCTCNGAQYLNEQLESLISQDYPHLEIVVADDLSTDGTWEMLLEYQQRDPRFRCYRNAQRLGLLGNFERVMELCRGELIAPCDQDDRWNARKLSRLYEVLGTASAVYCDSALMDASGKPLGCNLSDRFDMYEGSDPLVFALSNCVSGHAMLLRRAVFEAARPFPRIGFHDWWLAYVACHLGTLNYLPEALVDYRQHRGSQTDVLELRQGERRRNRWEVISHQAAWLAILASYNGAGEEVRKLHRLYGSWLNSYFSPALAHFMRRHWETLQRPLKIKKRRGAALKYFWGVKAKRLISPRRYRKKSLPGSSDRAKRVEGVGP